MNVTLLGFEGFEEVAKKISQLLLKNGHNVIENEKNAEMLFIPHHLDHLFPKQIPWVAFWLVGGVARFSDFAELQNKPLELIPDYQVDTHPEYFLNKLNK